MAHDSSPPARSAVEDVSLDNPLPFDPADDAPEPIHPEFVWVKFAAEQAPPNGLDYQATVEPTSMTRPSPQTEAANDTLARLELQVMEIARSLVTRGYLRAESGAAPQEVGPEIAKADPILIGYREAAVLLGITVGALKNRVMRGQVPPQAIVRSGDRVQFHVGRLREIRSPTPRRKRSTP